MRSNSNIDKACRYYLFKDNDTRLNNLFCAVVTILFNLLVYKGVFRQRGDDFLILFLYILIIGLSQISFNSMLINLTVKDKLNKRMEFILASGIKVDDLIKSYALEMWRLSSIIPFFLFYIAFVLYDFKEGLKAMVLIYLTSVLMLYFEILFLNIFSLFRKNFKFFKNIVFFTTTIIIYIVGNFSKDIIHFLKLYNINLAYMIIAINIFLFLIFFILTFRELKKIKNEDIIKLEGVWS